MRIYLPPVVSKLISLSVLLLSFALVFALATKAVKLWQTDPSLNQIPKIMQKSNSK